MQYSVLLHTAIVVHVVVAVISNTGIVAVIFVILPVKELVTKHGGRGYKMRKLWVRNFLRHPLKTG